jgi:aminopeptidase N
MGMAQYSRADSLRGTLNANRSWWNVLYYDLKVKFDIDNKSVKGSNCISFKPVSAGTVMQIDLQNPLQIDSAFFHNKKCRWTHEANAWMIELSGPVGQLRDSILVFYSGKPRAARFAPWDGGIIWGKDEKKRPWINVACQELGASVWWPNKDHQSDEPDLGMKISITIPDTLVNISNGNNIAVIQNPDRTATWVYQVKNPINNYDVTFNIGKYITETEFFDGANGKLKIEYCVLDYNKDKIENHLRKDTRNMLKCFEHWFGPYPFYEDGYRLVETTYLGMEHQSAISYGNKFRMGYLGRDRSGTGIGMLWDYIIVHESGHEWFGNNITSNDIADMWIHESFTTYSEALFVECIFNKDSACKYVQGLRRNIENDRNIIADYGVNREGSGDMYDKGANMVHIIRQIINNDSLFREILRGMNRDFAKKTVDGKTIEDYWITKSGKNLAPVFDQYLRSTDVPVFEYRISKEKLFYRFTNCKNNFTVPLRVYIDKKLVWLEPETIQKEFALPVKVKTVKVDKNFYINTNELK